MPLVLRGWSPAWVATPRVGTPTGLRFDCIGFPSRQVRRISGRRGLRKVAVGSPSDGSTWVERPLAANSPTRSNRGGGRLKGRPPMVIHAVESSPTQPRRRALVSVARRLLPVGDAVGQTPLRSPGSSAAVATSRRRPRAIAPACLELPVAWSELAGRNPGDLEAQCQGERSPHGQGRPGGGGAASRWNLTWPR
jgi:hypothetical protein